MRINTLLIGIGLLASGITYEAYAGSCTLQITTNCNAQATYNLVVGTARQKLTPSKSEIIYNCGNAPGYVEAIVGNVKTSTGLTTLYPGYDYRFSCKGSSKCECLKTGGR